VDLDQASTVELADLAAATLSRLAERDDRDAFAALLHLSQLAGEAVGASARTLARGSSWSGVADVAGTTRQAAWARWREL
jgi:hypothetical protein